uniref:Ferritin-like diiron domain-containing protein n=1 Tax=candidate division WOR-3 bacterium TaxID=2052148 RepID=A0A7C4U8X2_UNCW3
MIFHLKYKKREVIMGIMFTSQEVIETAISAEVNSEKFYEEMSKKVKNKEIKKLFEDLAKIEKSHINDFRKLYEKVKDKMEEIVGDEIEFSRYMRSYMESWVFKTFEEKKKNINIEDLNSIINFAISFERETILFYHGIKDNVSKEAGNIVNEIIKQEIEHIITLDNYLKELKGNIDELLFVSLEGELLASKFYKDAAKKAESDTAKRFFKELANYEMKHYEHLKKIIEAREGKKKIVKIDIEKLKEKIKPEVKGEFEPNKSEIAEVLQIGIESEKKAYERYKKLAEKIDDKEGSKIFEELAEEERKHQRILEDEFYNISNKGMIIWGD